MSDVLDPTVIDGITDAIVAKLQAIDQITDPDAVELEPAGDPDIFPALGVMIASGDVVEREAGLIRWEMTVTIEGFAQRGDGKVASAERAALHAAAIAALMSDDQLAGRVEAIDPMGWRYFTADLASKRRLGFGQDFAVQFTTSRTNPALPG